MIHKGNWPENNWTSRRGPILAISEMNTLIKMEMCAYTCVHVNFYVCAPAHTQSRGTQNI